MSFSARDKSVLKQPKYLILKFFYKSVKFCLHVCLLKCFIDENLKSLYVLSIKPIKPCLYFIQLQ